MHTFISFKLLHATKKLASSSSSQQNLNSSPCFLPTGPDERVLRGREAFIRLVQRPPPLRRDLLQDGLVGQPTGGPHRERPERFRLEEVTD